MEVQKVTVEEVAKELQLAPTTVRKFLEEQLFPFGICGKPSPDGRRVAYIHPILWEKFKKGELSF